MLCVRTKTRRIPRRAKAYGLIAILGLSLVLASFPDADVGYAADGLEAGEAYVTRFSGTVIEDGRTVIDTKGTVGSVIDIRAPGLEPHGAHWRDVPQQLAVTAGEVGQVFGIALDDASPPNIYLTATSAFGLHRTLDNSDWMAGMWGLGGEPGTIWKLDAGNNYRPSVFATITLDGRANTGAALGNIAYDTWNKQFYVSDLETGMIHRLGLDGTNLGHFDHGTVGRASFIDATTGAQSTLSQVPFDPNSAAKIKDCPGGDFSKTEDCWNFADFRRRVWGLGVRRDAATSQVRLYYAVWGSQGFGNTAWSAAGDDQRNSIWSVRIGPDASFDTADVRREFILPNFFSDPAQIASLGASQPVSDIAFPKFGEQNAMLLAERGGVRNISLAAAAPFARPHESRVLRYKLSEQGVWQTEGRYDVGYYDRKNHSQPYLRANASGGVDFGFGYSADWKAEQAQPDQFVWMTGDSLCSPEGPCVDPATGSATDTARVDGVQGTPVALSNDLEPAAGFKPYPPTGYATPDATPAGSYMIDVYPGGERARNDATKIGDVAVYQPLPEGVTEGWMPPGWTPPGLIPPSGYVPPSGWVPPPGWTPPSGWTPPPGWAPPPWWAPPQVPIVPPVAPAGLDLELTKVPLSNTCAPNAKCAFEIRITNKGTQAYVGPRLGFKDTMPKGWTFVSVLQGALACQQQGDLLSCDPGPTSPAQASLAPGWSDVMQVELQVPAPAAGQPAQVQVENCAEIDWKGAPGDGNKGNDKGCAKVGFSATAFDLEIKKAVPSVGGLGPGAGMLAAACTPGMNCTFEITITSKGLGSFTGPLNITDTMPAGWKFGSAGAPWACQQSGNAFTCTHPQTTLATNQSITLKVDLVPSAPTGSQPAEVENCAEIDWKGGAGDLNKNNDHGCEKVTIGVGPPDLQITKSGPASCKRNAACTYTINIKNVGQGKYNGPITIEERNFPFVGLKLDSAALPLPGSCNDTALGKIECDFGSLTLDPGASALVGYIHVFVPADYLPAADYLHDCVKITKSVAPVSNPEACADTPLEAAFDLKPTKMGPAQCQNPSKHCEFDISIQNVGKSAYEGPISITDTPKYPGAKLIDFQGPGWGCSQGAGGEVKCDYPWVKLLSTQYLTGLKLTFYLPGADLLEFNNCGKVVYKGGKPDANPNNDQACVTTPLQTTITGGAGFESTLLLDMFFPAFCIIAAGQTGGCTDYQFVISNTGPADYNLPMTLRVKLPEGAELKSAQGTQAAKSCPASGWSCEQSGQEVICRPSACSLAKDEKTAVLFDVHLLPHTPPEPPPPEGTTKTVCGELEWFAPPSKGVDIEQTGGKKYSRACGTTKILVKKPAEQEKLDLAIQKFGPAECSPGGKCSYSLTVLNASQIPFSGPIRLADKLPSGWKLSGSGNTTCTQQGDVVACERPTRTLQPGWTETIRIDAQVPENETRNEVENCAWLDYEKKQGDANAANDKSCAKTKLKGVSPAEECKNKGWIWDRRKQRCVPPLRPAEECKNKGWVWDGTRCLSPEEVCKNKGWEWDRRKQRCVPTLRPAEECKKKGWVWDGNRCLSPEEVCKNKGWEWDRRRSRCVPPLSPAEECKKKGWAWEGNRCLSPEEACRNRGWVWDRRSQRCVRPLSPEEECRKKGWVWEGNRCLSPEEACRNRGWVWDRRRQRCVPTMPECTGGKVRVGERCLCPPNTVEVRGRCQPRKAEELRQPPPATTPQLKTIPGLPFQIICPKGTAWSEPNKKCLPVVE